MLAEGNNLAHTQTLSLGQEHFKDFVVPLFIGYVAYTSIVGQVKSSIDTAEEMHQQFAVFLRTEQCLEYAIYLRVYAVLHGGFL